MSYPVFRTLAAILLLLQCVSSGPVQKKKYPYLYLGPNKVLELPSLAEISCQQDCPFGPPYDVIRGASAAVVPYAGTDTLMICGLSYDLRGCYVWRQGGWELSDILFDG